MYLFFAFLFFLSHPLSSPPLSFPPPLFPTPPLSPTPASPSQPLPLPDALFNQNALRDENVRWDLHQCKSFECLNTRSEGDCRNCFNLNMEVNRWKGFYRGAPPMKQVLDMKKGSIRWGAILYC